MLKLATITLLSATLALTGCRKENTEINGASFAREISAGAKAADFSARNAANEYMSISDFRGDVVIMTFWRKRCLECISGLDMMDNLYRRFSKNGFTVLAINGDNLDYVPSSTLWKLVKERGYTFPVLLDDRFTATERYKVINIPATFLIDRKGVISFVQNGEYDWLSEESLKRIGELLG